MQQKNKEEPIAYIEDVLEELHKRTGKPPELLKELVNINMEYVRKSVIDLDYMIIRFPKLGTMKINYRMAMSSWGNIKRKQMRGRKPDSIRRKLKILKAHLVEKEGKAKERIFNLATGEWLFFYLEGKLPFSAYNSFYHCWARLAEYHNKYHEKYFKK